MIAACNISGAYQLKEGVVIAHMPLSIAFSHVSNKIDGVHFSKLPFLLELRYICDADIIMSD